MKEKNFFYFFLVLFSFLIFPLSAQETELPELTVESQKTVYSEKQKAMQIKAEHIRLVPEKGNEYGGGGFHLYVKKIPGVESILLTETSRDPSGKNDSYAYRAKEFNPVNGNEKRILDGKLLQSDGAKFSLVDSTAQKTKNMGEVFHIYIPAVIVYGYNWTRHGELEIGKGTFINIRTFEKPYADYSGEYMDSAFMFNLVAKKKTVQLTDDYNPTANEKLQEISVDLAYSKGPSTIIQDITTILNSLEDKENLDVVFAIDTTGSMNNDLEKLKEEILPMFNAVFSKKENIRIGLLFFRDYGDTYHYRDIPVKVYGFTKNFNSIQQNLNAVRIFGSEGGDIPEAIYEAIYAAANFFDWRMDVNREVILITDADPHPTPRRTGKYSKDFVMEAINAKNIKIHTILLPKDN